MSKGAYATRAAPANALPASRQAPSCKQPAHKPPKTAHCQVAVSGGGGKDEHEQEQEPEVGETWRQLAA